MPGSSQGSSCHWLSTFLLSHIGLDVLVRGKPMNNPTGVSVRLEVKLLSVAKRRMNTVALMCPSLTSFLLTEIIRYSEVRGW